MSKTSRTSLLHILLSLAVLLFIVGCGARPDLATETSFSGSVSVAPEIAPGAIPSATTGEQKQSLTGWEIDTLNSLRKVDEHPLYTMHFKGTYPEPVSCSNLPHSSKDDPSDRSTPESAPAWGCSLYAAFGDLDSKLFGRNFDWRYSPALLLYADPSDGYASISMVDIEYLGFAGARSQELDALGLADRRPLLDAPAIPFDGMNDQGLVVGMAAVPPGNMQPDPGRPTIGSLGIIREILDHAGDTDEAVDIMRSFNVDMGEGPPLHYLISDPSGRSALVEFYQGDMVVMADDSPWHRATNFLRSAHDDDAKGVCWRYDEIGRRLEETEGRLTSQEAIDLLKSVSQLNTQWSIIYDMGHGDVSVVMDRQYHRIHRFRLDLDSRLGDSN